MTESRIPRDDDRKIFGWTDYTAPDFRLLPNGEIHFYDHPDLLDLKPGDMIHYSTRLSVTVFEIKAVSPADLRDYDPGLQRVVAIRVAEHFRTRGEVRSTDATDPLPED